MVKGKIILSILLLLVSEIGQSQEVYQGVFKPYYSLEFGYGTSNYVGDLAPWESFPESAFKTVGKNFNIGFNRFFTNRFSGKFTYQNSQLLADENLFPSNGKFEGNYFRNLHFENIVQSISFQGAYHFQKTRSNILKRQFFRLQVYSGLGLIYHSPKARPPVSLVNQIPQKKTWQNLHSVLTEGKDYSQFVLAIPFGISFQFKVTKQIDLGLNTSFYYTFTDYLDDVSDFRESSKPNSPNEFYDRSLEPFAANTLQNRIPIQVPSKIAISNLGNDIYINSIVQLIIHLKKPNRFNKLNN